MPEEDPEQDEDSSDYDSGPFCRHWSDPSDCEEVCAACGHHCRDHDLGSDSFCYADGCDCPAWV